MERPETTRKLPELLGFTGRALLIGNGPPRSYSRIRFASCGQCWVSDAEDDQRFTLAELQELADRSDQDVYAILFDFTQPPHGTRIVALNENGGKVSTPRTRRYDWWMEDNGASDPWTRVTERAAFIRVEAIPPSWAKDANWVST